ncbi:hypothetical protein D8X55_03565 [Malacoplasma penetrans]|nr:hypothetical protein D8X55_03565 [Malacoplasma penetrans]
MPNNEKITFKIKKNKHFKGLCPNVFGLIIWKRIKGEEKNKSFRPTANIIVIKNYVYYFKLEGLRDSKGKIKKFDKKTNIVVKKISLENCLEKIL